MKPKKELEIKVNEMIIEIDHYLSYAGQDKYFGLGLDGNLYYPKYDKKGEYRLLTSHFWNPKTRQVYRGK